MRDRHRGFDSSREILSALADEDCWEILTATADEPRTVSELCTECDIPMATAYRKVNQLVDLSLLDERIRVKPRGRNSREYRLWAETVHITVPIDSSTVSLDCTITTPEHARTQIPVLSTDGGQIRAGLPAFDRSDAKGEREPTDESN